MRTPRRLPSLVSGLALAVTVGLAAPAAAADAVGGPELGSRGLVLPVGAPPVPPEVVAHGWLVADLDTGEVLGAKDAHGKYAPASTLKILTAVALIPQLDPARKVVPTFDDVAVDGSKVGLVERVGYPVDELFAALMMVSGNDVANTLASAAGGPAAIEAMNAEAQRLQAYDTRAVNPQRPGRGGADQLGVRPGAAGPGRHAGRGVPALRLAAPRAVSAARAASGSRPTTTTSCSATTTARWASRTATPAGPRPASSGRRSATAARSWSR